MKKYFVDFSLYLFIIILNTSCNNIGANSNQNNVNLQTLNYYKPWDYVGNSNFITSNTLPNLVSSPIKNNLYIASDDYSNDIHVMKYDGSKWSELGFAGSIAHGSYPKIAFNKTDEQPFVVFSSINDNKLSVITYNGNSWVYVGNPEFSAHGSNKLSSSIAMDNSNNLYVAYNGIDDRKAHVMIYNKFSNSWKEVGDIQDSSGISLKLAINPNNNHPYIITETKTSVPVVKEFDGTSWINIGQMPSEYKSIPYSLDITFDPINGFPFIVYQSTNSKGIVVLTYNGNTWSYLGDRIVNENSYINNVSLAINNAGKPYIMFSDLKYNGKLSAMSFDGKQWNNMGTPGFSKLSNLQTSFLVIGDAKKTTMYGVAQDINGISVLSNEDVPISKISWFKSNMDIQFSDVSYGGGIWVASGYLDTGLLWSTDGKIWNQSNLSKGRFFKVTYANGIWIATSQNTVSSSLVGLFWSANGKDWVSSNVVDSNSWGSYYGNGVWVSSGYFNVREESQINIRKEQNSNDNYLLKTDRQLANIEDGSVPDMLVWSADGKVWKPSNIVDKSLFYAHYANSLWLASVGSMVYWSSDGKNWDTTSLKCACYINYANGLWVAASRNETEVYWSLDGKSWQDGSITPGSGSGGGIDDLEYANGTWVIVGPHGAYWSTDGKIWNKSNITNTWARAVKYANGIWIIGINASQSIYWSYDGKTWTNSDEPAGYITSLFYANGIWVSAGYRLFYGIENN